MPCKHSHDSPPPLSATSFPGLLPHLGEGRFFIAPPPHEGEALGTRLQIEGEGSRDYASTALRGTGAVWEIEWSFYPSPSPSESLLGGYIIDCRLYRNQNYASKLRRKRRDKQTSALISLNIILILIIIVSIIFIRNSIGCSDVRTVQGRVDCGWRKYCWTLLNQWNYIMGTHS